MTAVRPCESERQPMGSSWVRVLVHWASQYARTAAVQPGGLVRAGGPDDVAGDQARRPLDVSGVVPGVRLPQQALVGRGHSPRTRSRTAAGWDRNGW